MKIRSKNIKELTATERKVLLDAIKRGPTTEAQISPEQLQTLYDKLTTTDLKRTTWLGAKISRAIKNFLGLRISSAKLCSEIINSQAAVPKLPDHMISKMKDYLNNATSVFYPVELNGEVDNKKLDKSYWEWKATGDGMTLTLPLTIEGSAGVLIRIDDHPNPKSASFNEDGLNSKSSSPSFDGYSAKVTKKADTLTLTIPKYAMLRHLDPEFSPVPEKALSLKDAFWAKTKEEESIFENLRDSISSSINEKTPKGTFNPRCSVSLKYKNSFPKKIIINIAEIDETKAMEHLNRIFPDLDAFKCEKDMSGGVKLTLDREAALLFHKHQMSQMPETRK